MHGGAHNHVSGETKCSHSHQPASFGGAFAIGISLNLLYVIVEGSFGYLTGSLALMADASHNLGDVFSLLVAWGAFSLSKRPTSKRFTYGLRRSSILAALFNSTLLLVAVGAIGLEAIRRITDPAPIPGGTVMVVAIIGIIINTTTAMLFFSGRHSDINIKGAYLHMAADAAVSGAVVIAALGMMQTGWAWLDPVVSLVIAGVIFWSTWGLLRESLFLAMDAVPNAVNSDDVRSFLLAAPLVTQVHDLHIWSYSTTEIALTAHIVRNSAEVDDNFTQTVCEELHKKFGIDHSTIQIERGSDACSTSCENSLAT